MSNLLNDFEANIQFIRALEANGVTLADLQRCSNKDSPEVKKLAKVLRQEWGVMAPLPEDVIGERWQASLRRGIIKTLDWFCFLDSGTPLNLKEDVYVSNEGSIESFYPWQDWFTDYFPPRGRVIRFDGFNSIALSPEEQVSQLVKSGEEIAPLQSVAELLRIFSITKPKLDLPNSNQVIRNRYSSSELLRNIERQERGNDVFVRCRVRGTDCWIGNRYSNASHLTVTTKLPKSDRRGRKTIIGCAITNKD